MPLRNVDVAACPGVKLASAAATAAMRRILFI
jgi:hypothetical protein